MSEETTPPAAPPEQPPAAPTEPTSPFKEDGTLVENWHTLAPEGYEDLRKDKTLPRFNGKSIWEFGRSHVHLRKQVPLDKMPRPNENFTDADWEDYYRAGGWPETPGDYNIVRPADFPEDLWDDDRVAKYQDFFHKIHLNKGQVDALTKLNNEEVLALKQSREQQEEIDFNILKDGLVKKWGMAYDQKTHIGNIAIEKGTIKGKDGKVDLDAKERLIEKINADPDLLEFTSNLGSLFTEHGIVEDTQIPTPGDMDAKISEAMQHPAYMNDKHPDHDRQVQLVTQLIKEKNKQTKKTE